MLNIRRAALSDLDAITKIYNEVLHLNTCFGFEVVGTFKEVGRKFGKLLDVAYLQKFLN